jgi:hypothetical protein
MVLIPAWAGHGDMMRDKESLAIISGRSKSDQPERCAQVRSAGPDRPAATAVLAKPVAIKWFFSRTESESGHFRPTQASPYSWPISHQTQPTI